MQINCANPLIPLGVFISIFYVRIFNKSFMESSDKYLSLTSMVRRHKKGTKLKDCRTNYSQLGEGKYLLTPLLKQFLHMLWASLRFLGDYEKICKSCYGHSDGVRRKRAKELCGLCGKRIEAKDIEFLSTSTKFCMQNNDKSILIL